jgi:predicted RNA-binding Zn-ribbon protein involved in translation (DUF1610 family)
VATKDSFWMTSTRRSFCTECEDEIATGDRIVWDPVDYLAYCTSCGEDILGKEPE